MTALHRAIICKKQAITNYLLRESANPFVRDKVSTNQELSLETVDFEVTVPLHYVISYLSTDLKILTMSCHSLKLFIILESLSILD